MKIHVLILCIIVGVIAGGRAYAADDLALPGLASGLAFEIAPSDLIADQRDSSAEAKSLEDVLESIQQSFPGRALDARVIDHSGRQAYKIRWMGDNGRVSDITADAMSGEIVERR